MRVSVRAVYAGVVEVSIYIAPEYTRKGAGTILPRALIAASEQHGVWMLQSGIWGGMLQVSGCTRGAVSGLSGTGKRSAVIGTGHGGM